MRTRRVDEVIAAADDERRAHTALPSDTGGLAGLAEWLGDAGPRAPSLGMIVVRSGARGLTSQLRGHAARIGRVGDIIVDVPPDAAMMVAPGLHGEALEARADEVCGLLVRGPGTGEVDALAVDVPAEHARRDLVGSLGVALRLRQRQTAERLIPRPDAGQAGAGSTSSTARSVTSPSRMRKARIVGASRSCRVTIA